jgi:hypothetical protein
MPLNLNSLLSLEDLAIGVRFLLGLPSFLRHSIRPREARAILQHRLDHREHDFLSIVRRAIYAYPQSPYNQLLQLAGCTYGDLERMVLQEGIERVLRILYGHGVYLTVDEFKGRRPIIRGSAKITIDPNWLRNPHSGFHIPALSSGNRSGGTPALIDLAFVRDCAVDTCLSFEARGGSNWIKAHWQVPGSAVIARLIEFASIGMAPVHWFSHIDPAAEGLHPRYRWSARVMRWGSLLAGVPLPLPLHVSFDNPFPIVRWLEKVLGKGNSPHIWTFVSSAVRLCQTALEAGVDLHGVHFTATGEPLTAACLRLIHQAGDRALPAYGSIECGYVGYGCLSPEAPDEVHLLHDLNAVIPPGNDGAATGISPQTLLVTSLRSTAPFILLNVSMGDQAIVVTRKCGCPLEQLGWATHIHEIRSFEKLTCGGMTFLDADIVRVLEEVLPARFGGVPNDYQLVEEEGEEKKPGLRLLVHPAVGPLEPREVADAFMAAVCTGSGTERVMALFWSDANILRVERRTPLATPSGKILHLHLQRRL